MQQLGNPSRYSVDLVDLHSLCEANYLRLLRLFPDYEHANRRVVLAGAARVELEVSERSRYTTMLHLLQYTPGLPQGLLRFDLRLYHDAHMAEVVAWQRNRQIPGRYPYPNPEMFQRDEKRQQNHYLAELLAFCLAEGRAPDATALAGVK